MNNKSRIIDKNSCVYVYMCVFKERTTWISR